jgi:hypothetical protein
VVRWPTLLLPGYVTTNLLLCPSEKVPNPVTGGSNPAYPADEAYRSYIINGFNDGFDAKYGAAGWHSLTTTSNAPFLRENDITEPSATIIMSEKSATAPDFYMDYDQFDDVAKLDQAKHSGSLVNTNIGGSVYLYADGSAHFLLVNKSFAPTDLWGTTPQARTNSAIP